MPPLAPPRATAAVAAAIAAMHAALFAAWCLLRDPGAAHDDANLLLWAVDLEAWIRAGARGGLPANVRGAPYPPAVPLLAAGHFLLAGARSVGLACASAWPYLSLLSAAGWSAGRRAWGPRGGLALAALAPLPLWSLGHPGSFHADLPLGCAIGAAALLADGRLSLGRGVAVGLLGAVALWTKWTAALFLGPLLLVGLLRRESRRGALAAALACAACAAPWYLPELPRILAFARGNLAGEYTGEAAGPGLAAAFYPARLLTGVWGTPLLLLTLAGALSRRPGPHRRALLTLAAGVALLTLQPYRDERYLLAGLGLVAPLTVAGARAVGGAWALRAVGLLALWWTMSWLPGPDAPADSSAWVRPLIEDRDGLRRRGLRQARRELLRPRLRRRGPLPDPLRPPPPLRQAARALHRAAPPGPLTVHVVDTVGRSVLERLKVELALLRGPGVQISRPAAREAALLAQAGQGRVDGWLPPPQLSGRAWVVESLDPEALGGLQPAWAALADQGRAVVFRGGATAGERPAAVQVWGPPGRRR